MNTGEITLVLAVASVLISIGTFWIAYCQMRIASAKTRLDLYDKRFNVYSMALDLYRSTFDDAYDQLKEMRIVFIKSYRESQFLFDKKDGIYETLGRIQQKGASIYEYERMKHEPESGADSDQDCLRLHHQKSMDARVTFEEDLVSLEKQIEKYIKFNTLSGW